MFYIQVGFFGKKMIDSLISSFLMTMSNSLRLLTKNECMSELLVFLSESLICSFFAKNERFPQKTDERIPSPALFTLFYSLEYSNRVVEHYSEFSHFFLHSLYNFNPVVKRLPS